MSVKIEHLTEEQIQAQGIRQWPIWEKEVSTFDWFYDNTEQCLILEGEVIVKTDQGDFEIKAGDFVTFEKGLECFWEIKKEIRKHYNFL